MKRKGGMKMVRMSEFYSDEYLTDEEMNEMYIEEERDRREISMGARLLHSMRGCLNEGKLILVREPVPSGSVGISIVFDDDRKCHGTLDIKQHKELLLQVAEAIAIEETGSEEE